MRRILGATLVVAMSAGALVAGQGFVVMRGREYQLAPVVINQSVGPCGRYFLLPGVELNNLVLTTPDVVYIEIMSSIRGVPNGASFVGQNKILTVLEKGKPYPTVTLAGPISQRKENLGFPTPAFYIIRLSPEDYMAARSCLPEPMRQLEG